MNCGLEFGLASALALARRHHCRVCGAVICTDCCQNVLYVALGEIINTQLHQQVDLEEAMKICEYCFLEVIKLKDKCDQKETDSVINALYVRWCKVRNELEKCCQMLPHHTREPIVFKVL